MKSMTAITSLLLLLASAFHATGHTVFDVTKYGARGDGVTDIRQALLKAWVEACSSPVASTILIPGGRFALGQVIFVGPCKAPINFVVKGTLRAPTDTSKFNSRAGWVTFQRIDQFTLSGGGVFDGEGTHIWGKKCSMTKYCSQLPINLRFDFITNGIVKDITSKNSKQFHINVMGCKNLAFKKVTIIAPDESPNTDGIHMGRCSGINITDSIIQTGDDCISIGDGSEQIRIERVNCGPGHGISIGSLGLYPNEAPVVGVRVKNCTFTNTENGVRIKTWASQYQGSASDMHFEDMIMNNVQNPIIIDQQYCPHNRCNNKISSLVQLSNISFRKIRGTTSDEVPVKLVCSQTLPCKQVVLEDINLAYSGANAISAQLGHIASLCKNIKPSLFGLKLPGCI